MTLNDLEGPLKLTLLRVYVPFTSHQQNA